MKEIAYRTNCCHKLIKENDAHGVLYIPDFVNILLSYVTVDPNKSNIHYCTNCYINMVIDAANRISPKGRDREKYDDAVKELAYSFKKNLFKNLEIGL